MALIEFEGVTKRYPGAATGAPAVDSLDLTIEAGEFLTLLGPSGSGKTTTLMLLAGFEAPTAGVIRLDGKPIHALPPHKRNMGIVFQSYSLFPHMTVAENVAFPLSVRGIPAADARGRVTAALAKVRLDEFAQRKPAQLSGGQQQRVALARALVFEPRLVLMDEPLSALDKRLREAMQLEIRRLHRELGVTMVYVTHDQSEAMTLSDRVALFNGGRIEQVASPQTLYDAPANPFVASFLGDNNIVAGTRQAQAVLCTARGTVLRGRPGPASAGSGNGRAMLCVRPESLRVGIDGAPLEADNVLAATLVDAIHQGDHWRLVMRLDDGGGAGTVAGTEGGGGTAAQWFAKLSPAALPAGLRPGQPLKLAFRADDAWVY